VNSAVAVAGGIIEKEGLILLAQRPPGKAHAGVWEFPGGKIEAGESAAEALQRELKEELHLDVRIGKFLGIFHHKYTIGAIDLHVFQVTALNEPRPTEDVQEFVWLRPAEVSQYELAAADLAPWKAYLALRPL
jgi:mutator protein MutT